MNNVSVQEHVTSLCISCPVVIQLEPNMHSDMRGQGEYNQSRVLNNLPFQAAI